MSKANASPQTVRNDWFPFAGRAPSAAIQPVVANMTEFNSKAVASWMEMNREWTSFLTRRLQEDAALVHHLATCASPQDVYSVYTEFFQKAFADYQREFTSMMQFGQTLLTETPTAAQPAGENRARPTVRPAT